MSFVDGNAAAGDASAMTRPSSPGSLEVRIAGWTAVICGALVILASIVMYAALATGLADMDDQILDTRLKTILMVLNFEPVEATLVDHEVHEYTEGLRPIYTRVLRGSGEIWKQTPGMPDDLPLHSLVSTDPAGRKVTVTTPKGQRLRMLVAKAGPVPAGENTGSDYILQLALDTTYNYDVIDNYRVVLAIVLIATLLATALMVRQTVRRALLPLVKITRDADRISTKTFNHRLDPTGLPRELHSLIAAFNELLTRLETSYHRLDQFSDNIAHELRSPISNMTLGAEVALLKPRTTDEYREILESQLEETTRLSRLVADLLLLARYEKGAEDIDCQDIDVQREFLILQEYFETTAAERSINLECSCPTTFVLRANRLLFQRAIGNLISNSLEHTRAGGAIRLHARCGKGTIVFSISDSGDGISPEDLAHVLERFYRADRTRNSSDGNRGLGLSIVKSIVELHGGTARICSIRHKGTEVTLEFPLGRVSSA